MGYKKHGDLVESYQRWNYLGTEKRNVRLYINIRWLNFLFFFYLFIFFWAMFPRSKVANKFSPAKTKFSFMITYSIVHYVESLLLEAIKHSDNFSLFFVRWVIEQFKWKWVNGYCNKIWVRFQVNQIWD